MSDSMLVQQGKKDSANSLGQPQLLEKLRELTRNGYLPDGEADVAPGALLLRHDNGPDLILMPDGSIQLPATQSPRRAAAAALEPETAVPAGPPARKRMSWRRTFAFFLLAAIIWFVSIFLTVAFLSS